MVPYSQLFGEFATQKMVISHELKRLKFKEVLPTLCSDHEPVVPDLLVVELLDERYVPAEAVDGELHLGVAPDDCVADGRVGAHVCIRRSAKSENFFRHCCCEKTIDLL